MQLAEEMHIHWHYCLVEGARLVDAFEVIMKITALHLARRLGLVSWCWTHVVPHSLRKPGQQLLLIRHSVIHILPYSFQIHGKDPGLFNQLLAISCHSNA